MGAAADAPRLYESLLPEAIRRKFEIFSYRGAAAILAHNFPGQFSQIVTALEAFTIRKTMIRTPGGSKSEIAHYVDTLC